MPQGAWRAVLEAAAQRGPLADTRFGGVGSVEGGGVCEVDSVGPGLEPERLAPERGPARGERRRGRREA